MKKQYSFSDVVKITVLATVGASALFSHSNFALNLESSMAVLAVWVVGGAIAILSSCCYAELHAIIPSGGGDATYLTASFSKYLGLLSIGFSAAVVLPASSASSLASLFQKLELENMPAKIALCVGSVSIIYFPEAIRSFICTALLLAKFLSMLILLPCFYHEFVANRSTSFLFTKFNFSISNIKNLKKCLIQTIFYYSGYNTCNFYDGTRMPDLFAPYSASVLLITVIYMAYSLGFMVSLDSAKITEDNAVLSLLNKTLETYPKRAHSIITAFIYLALYTGSIFSCNLVYSEIIDGLKRRFKLPPKYAFNFLFAAVLCCLALGDTADKLIIKTGVIMSLFYCLTFVALFKLRWMYSEKRRLNVVIPSIAFLVTVVLLVDTMCSSGPISDFIAFIKSKMN
ncbi:hypothetical protein ENBRE01_0300 [Enteropsectra breve]|nr:hypothetical protein ENBRE01_0300 [Enteropsectra breve]